MENAKETKESGKQIQEIWTEAFATSASVKLCGKVRGNRFTKAWFECADGRTYPLTKQELKEYKPDALIHRNFK